ncbi:MAG: AI-2E family transporter [bacterium]|nr:AI-2E family transporter [bacterium]
MVIKFKTIFFLVLAVVAIWFLYTERAILAPFVLAGIFAYVFNPVVEFFNQKIRLPKTVSILIIYIVLIGSVTIFSILLTKRIITESSELKNYVDHLAKITFNEVNTLPDWIRPTVEESLNSLEKSKIFSTQYLFSLFPQAISRIVSFFLFLFSAFYFLKEGKNVFNSILNLVPNKHKVDVEILARKINLVLGGYLRGQLILIFLVSLILYICLSILNVRFALILAIFSGFAEIVPIIGPITAGVVAALIVVVTNSSSFSMPPFQVAIAVAITYFLVRMFQDYFINPHILGRITKLHPLIILFAVVSGGHLWGILGLILAVPIAASIKIILEFALDKISEEQN